MADDAPTDAPEPLSRAERLARFDASIVRDLSTLPVWLQNNIRARGEIALARRKAAQRRAQQG